MRMEPLGSAKPDSPRGASGVPISRRLLARDRVRYAVTTVAVGSAVSLVLFLFGALEGVQREANGYVASRDVDVWVSHMNSDNLIRSTSFMLSTIGEALDTLPQVAGAAPLLRTIVRMETDKGSATFFVLGVNPALPATRPTVVEGSQIQGRGEIVLDRAFAQSQGLRVGQAIRVQPLTLRIVGLSTGTNALVTQFAFTALEDAQELLGFEGIVSFWLLNGKQSVSREELAGVVKERIPELNSIPQEQFSTNNRDQLKVGVVPLLWATAIFSSLAGGVTLGLLLYVGVVERREDYAYFMAVGASKGWVDSLVVRQAVLTVGVGLMLGLAIFGVSVPILGVLVPQVTFVATPGVLLLVAGFALAIGVIAVFPPLYQLRRIHPGEVFRP